jgi:hypothetical protein
LVPPSLHCALTQTKPFSSTTNYPSGSYEDTWFSFACWSWWDLVAHVVDDCQQSSHSDDEQPANAGHRGPIVADLCCHHHDGCCCHHCGVYHCPP